MKTPTPSGSSSITDGHTDMSGRQKASNQDLESELGIHPVCRPVNIEKDVSSLGQKKRVSSILRSPDFKEELESVVTDLLQSGKGGGHVIARAIANVFSPTGRSSNQGIGCVSPINDLTGADTSLYSKGEKLLRCKLAALYRIVDLYGWTSAIYNHITVRVSQEQEHFLINPFGLLYHEVSASKLIKVNMQGDVVDTGSTTLGFNRAGYTLHSAIHASRPDIHCVIHVHTSDAVAVSCMECGLLPISQEALIVGEISYHTYHGILVDNKEKKAIQKHLGPNNKVMMLRNHGLVACGATVEEAFHYLYNTMIACSIQVKAMSCMKYEKLIHLDRSALKSRTEDVGKKDITGGKEDGVKWEIGEMMFEALIRMLDDMGYRSGYSYRNPVVVQHKPRIKSDVELPATVVGHTPVLPEDLEDARGMLRHNEQSRWVNSPNQYTRIVESAEEEVTSAASSQNGDASPRVRTKWRRNEEGEASKSTAVRIADPNQFVPTNTDPLEVLATRKSIRGQGRWDHNRPGPQSQLLHSVSPDRATVQVTCDDAYLSFSFDDVASVLHNPFLDQGVATSSKAIIQKGIEVELVSPIGPPNPFNAMKTDDAEQHEQGCGQLKGLNSEKDGKESLPEGTSGPSSVSPQPSNVENTGTAGIAVLEEEVPAPLSPSGAANSNENHHASKEHNDAGDVIHEQKEVGSPKKESALVKEERKVIGSPIQEKNPGSPNPGTKDSSKKKKKRPLSFLKKKK